MNKYFKLWKEMIDKIKQNDSPKRQKLITNDFIQLIPVTELKRSTNTFVVN